MERADTRTNKIKTQRTIKNQVKRGHWKKGDQVGTVVRESVDIAVLLINTITFFYTIAHSITVLTSSRVRVRSY